MEEFLRNLRNKNIHIVGVTGAEGSNILRFLIKNKISNISTHDLLLENSIEKSFKLWHKGLKVNEREILFKQFKSDLIKTKFYSKKDYLKNILSADIIFVPQSWRLYKEQNQPLWKAKRKNIPFYSLTRLYLELTPAKIIAVTGTVGKGSVANMIFQLLKTDRRKVYFAGNETWRLQLADKLDQMKKEDILILEISHRQLIDGISSAPDIVVFTNLYPNHLDEVTWKEYKKLKLSLLELQKPDDISILNYDIPELRKIGSRLISKVYYFSTKNQDVNIKSIQKIYENILSKKLPHYRSNILAASTTACLLRVKPEKIIQILPQINSLTARLECIGEISGVKFYDDIKSTTPWATIAAVNQLHPGVILIIGGRTKGIDYQDFARIIKSKVKFIYIMKSQLGEILRKLLPDNKYKIVDSLDVTVKDAHNLAKKGDKIVISPAAGFFYTDFIKGKKSLRKIIREVCVS